MTMLTQYPDGHGSTIYDALSELGILRKVLGISVHRARVPPDLENDAKQEILEYWAKLPARGDVSTSQLAAYAYSAGFQRALKVKRDLNAAISLPSSAFRKRSDGSSYVTPGVLASPLDWDALAETLDQDDTELYQIQGDTPIEQDYEAWHRQALRKLESIPNLKEAEKEWVRLLLKGYTFAEATQLTDLPKKTVSQLKIQLQELAP